jgi:hypothetical protein
VAQCQEVFTGKNGWEYRDTDVQKPVEDLKDLPESLTLWLDAPTAGSSRLRGGSAGRLGWADNWLGLLEVDRVDHQLARLRDCGS